MSESTTLLFADKVVTGDSAYRVEPAVIAISGTTVTEIEPCSRAEFEAREQRVDTNVVDLGNRLVAPAFVNGHTHLPMAAYRGIGGLEATRGNVIEEVYFRIETSITSDDIRAFARIGAYESLLAGVGTVWDHYYGARAVAEAIAEVGLTGVVAPTLQDIEGPGVARCDEYLDEGMAIAADAGLADAGVFAALGPHASDTVSDELWQRIHAAARQHSLPIHVHLAQSIDEYRRSFQRSQQSPIARLSRLGVLDDLVHAVLVHGIYVSEADLNLLDRERHTLGFCPFSQLQFVFPAQVASWTDAGMRWLVATDCAASNDTMNVQQELRLVAGLRMTPTTASPEYELFRGSGSLEHAEAVHRHRQSDFQRYGTHSDSSFLLSRVWDVPGTMHPGFRVGAIRKGYLANLLVIDPEHPCLWPCSDPLRALVMSDVAPAIESMMVRGRWLGRRGEFRRSLLDGGYREAVAEANRRLELLGLDSAFPNS